MPFSEVIGANRGNRICGRIPYSEFTGLGTKLFLACIGRAAKYGVLAVMIPAGYMAKIVEKKPDWLKAPNVHDVYSASACVSGVFVNYINYWKHNGWWFFNSPKIIKELAAKHGLDLTQTTFFYYELFERQFYEK